jgi:hypothetical protein
MLKLSVRATGIKWAIREREREREKGVFPPTVIATDNLRPFRDKLTWCKK